MRISYAGFGCFASLSVAAVSGACSSQAPASSPSGATCAVVPRGDGTTSADILNLQGASCLSCAIANGCLDPASAGGCCEIVTGNAASGGMTESALCLKTMNDIFDSKCATVMGAHFDVGNAIEPGCLCGMESDICVTGSEAPAGPVYPDYAADFGPDAGTIDQDFIGAKFGAGQANDVIQCAFNSQCDCFEPGAFDGGVGDGEGALADDGGGAD